MHSPFPPSPRKRVRPCASQSGGPSGSSIRVGRQTQGSHNPAREILRLLVAMLLSHAHFQALLKTSPNTRLEGEESYWLRARVRLAKRLFRAWLWAESRGVTPKGDVSVPNLWARGKASPPKLAMSGRARFFAQQHVAPKFRAKLRLWDTPPKPRKAKPKDQKTASTALIPEAQIWLFGEVRSAPKAYGQAATHPPRPRHAKAGQVQADLERMAEILSAPEKALARIAKRRARAESTAQNIRKLPMPIKPKLPSKSLFKRLEIDAEEVAWWQSFAALDDPPLTVDST